MFKLLFKLLFKLWKKEGTKLCRRKPQVVFQMKRLGDVIFYCIIIPSETSRFPESNEILPLGLKSWRFGRYTITTTV